MVVAPVQLDARTVYPGPITEPIMLCSCDDARVEQLKAAEKQSALPPVEMGVTAFPAPPLKQVEALPAEAGQLWAAAEGASASTRATRVRERSMSLFVGSAIDSISSKK